MRSKHFVKGKKNFRIVIIPLKLNMQSNQGGWGVNWVFFKNFLQNNEKSSI